MYKAANIAKYIIKLSIDTGEPVTNMKLQKLLYYAYSWFLVEKENKERLFEESVEAWQYGPVVRDVYSLYISKGADIIDEPILGDTVDEEIDEDTKKLIYETFIAYGDKTAIQLMRLTHNETPWLKTYVEGRKDVIPDELIYDYYLGKKQQALASQ